MIHIFVFILLLINGHENNESSVERKRNPANHGDDNTRTLCSAKISTTRKFDSEQVKRSTKSKDGAKQVQVKAGRQAAGPFIYI